MNKIKQFREQQGFTIRELSEKSNVAVSYISELENDRNNKKNPSKDVMDRIALALGTTVPELFY